ncbi:MAG: helix-turn-helix domain-containing protein [Propionibacteriaceae bacterium]|nr:helix-turn-helix domain-containing protein [Propionibacteriaceae bacterium]
MERGGSVEATARQLYVHPNTVRYRLRRIARLTGLEPASSQDAFVLNVALRLSRL